MIPDTRSRRPDPRDAGWSAESFSVAQKPRIGLMVVPPPSDREETERLRALAEIEILDTLPEAGFDKLTEAAARLLNMPIALVSLVDANRQWFKSRVGLDAQETPRAVSFCGHAILSDDLFVIPDAQSDDRFKDNPLVTGHPHIRFYAGAPLITSDHYRLGTLCVIDTKPRELTDDERDVLRILADQAQLQFELRRTLRHMAGLQRRWFGILDTLPVGVFVLDAGGTPYYQNRLAEQILAKPVLQVSPDALAGTYGICEWDR